MLNLKANIK